MVVVQMRRTVGQLKHEGARIDRKRTLATVNKERKRQGKEPFMSVEDIRDETVALLRNAHTGKDWIRETVAAGGPTAQTLEKWWDKRIFQPQMPTVRKALRTIGKDIGIIDLKG